MRCSRCDRVASNAEAADWIYVHEGSGALANPSSPPTYTYCSAECERVWLALRGETVAENERRACRRAGRGE